MTFSICAFEPKTGELGVAVQSKWLAIGAYTPWARPAVGAIATQSFFNTGYGPQGLRLLSEERTPKEVVARLTADDRGRARRQVGVVDAQGRTAVFTGVDCMAWAGHRSGNGYCVQGNALAGPEVLDGMAEAFTRTAGTFAARLVAALAAGQAQGGDRRGMQSAALLIVREEAQAERLDTQPIDLRVDDHPSPIEELTRLLQLRLG